MSRISQHQISIQIFSIQKDYVARTCEALVVGKMKQQIFDHSSIYQIGGQANHCIEEHLFSIKSLIALQEHLGKGVFLTLVDIVAFFDRKDIRDVMQTLYKIGVNQKAARVWFKLNSKTEIAVKTASGITETEMVDDWSPGIISPQ